VVSVLDEITSKMLGFCYDSSHDRLYSLKEFDILEKCGKRLIATHFSDNDGLTDGHWLPQTGSINWNSLFKMFPNDYRGCISLEVVKGDEAVSSEVFLEKAFQKAKWIESNLCGDANESSESRQ